MGVSAAERYLLRRPVLEERLDESFGRRLTQLIAGAGYGKSTIIAQWAEELEAALCTVLPKDRQLSALATALADALEPWIGAPSDEFLRALVGRQDELASAEAVAAHFCEALESALAHDLVVVLDDAHEIRASAPSLRLIEGLCRQAPDALHLVVVSRDALELRVDRLRAQGEVAELVSSDLAFSSAEVSELSRALLGGEDEIAARVQALTEGWPAAVRLTLEILAAVPSSERFSTLERLNRPGDPLFSYLAHEVFERETADVRRLIRTVTPLERFTPELCDVLGILDAAETLDALAKRGLFFQRHGETYALHALVREFARSAWPLTDEEMQSLQIRAAEWFESEGRIADALGELAAASQDRDIARVLDVHGKDLLLSGQAQVVVDHTSALPSELVGAKLEENLGEAHSLLGGFDAAILAYERAAAKAGEVSSALAWRLGVVHRNRGSDEKALESYARASVPKGGDQADDALLLAWAASAHWLHGDFEIARMYAARALEIARRSGDDRALAAACVAADTTGVEDQTNGENNLLDVALRAAERCGDLTQLERIRVNRAARLTDQGEYGQALAELDAAVTLAEISGIEVPERALTNRARIHLRLGHLDKAHDDYATAVERSKESGTWERRYGYIGLGDVHRDRGNVALARAAYEHALRLSEGGENVYALVMSLRGLASVLVDDEPDEARRTAGRAAEQRWEYQAWALNTSGWVALALGDGEEAADAAARATSLAREQNDAYALAEAIELGVFSNGNPESERRRLEEALTIWRSLDSRVRIAECELALAKLSTGSKAQAARDRALRKLHVLGVRANADGPAGLMRTVAEPTPAAIAVQVLGGFRVLRDGVPIPLASWQSKRARDLLKILVSRRGRPVPRDMLMEALWPGDDPAKLSNRLSVSLSTLRSVLDPENRFDTEHFVRADRSSVALDLTAVLVDVEVFLHGAEIGLGLLGEGKVEDATEWLAQAESAYAGEVLEDDPYTDWAISLREEARATYLSVADALGRGAAVRGDDHAAARYFLRTLGHDRYDEGAHLGLVSVLDRSGRRGEARRYYRSYVARMEEIGATPASFPSSAASPP